MRNEPTRKAVRLAATIRGAELLVTDGEQKSGKTMPDLRFRITINYRPVNRSGSPVEVWQPPIKRAELFVSTLTLMPKPDKMRHRYVFRLDDGDNARFLALFDESGKVVTKTIIQRMPKPD